MSKRFVIASSATWLPPNTAYRCPMVARHLLLTRRTSPDGSVTTLHNSIFSTVPGSPAWVGKADRFAVDLPQHGWTYEFEGRNAIQSDWKIEFAGA